MKKVLFIVILIVLSIGSVFSQQRDTIQSMHQIYIDGTRPNKTFEGYGSLSAGASTRLLYDYPEPYRSEILDYLFKPNFGANIHHLKVEIGGDINSTDGSEPSIAATREEFDNPQSGFFKRGYEYWLMAEARKRNPNIILEGLQWGAPGWIGNGNFFTKDNADFVCAWLKGAEKYWNCSVQYIGVWNEKLYDKEYIKLLRKTLDKNGLQNVIIDAGDLWQSSERWLIADDMLRDPELYKAIGVINAHSAEETNYITTENVRKINKPVWSGESHFYGNSWESAAGWARSYRSYMVDGFTKIINWSIITSYHDYLTVPRSGVMVANTPWSGHYEVLASIWALAHINQFAQPGWKYLDSGCKWWNGANSSNEGVSMVSLRSPVTNDYSIIIETMDAKEPQTLHIKLSDDLSTKDLSVFRSVFNGEEFIKQADIKLENREFAITVQPKSIYSLTTTSGQGKGIAEHKIPKIGEQSINYSNDFESQNLNSPAKYFSDQHGTFEVVPLPDKKGKCLKQISITPGICWRCSYKNPLSFMGEINWKNYRFSADFLIPDSGEVFFIGRANNLAPEWGSFPYVGYALHFQSNGAWELKIENGKSLASGVFKNSVNKWHSVEMIFNIDSIKVVIDGKIKAEVVDSTFNHGVIAIGTGWNEACFDNIKISPVF